MRDLACHVRTIIPRRRLFLTLLGFGCALCCGTAAAAQAPRSAAPDLAERRFQAAQTFQIAGDYDKAATEYRAAISVALEELGRQSLSQNRIAEAIQLLTLSAGADPSNTSVRLDLAVAQFQEGDLAAAQESSNDVLRTNPRNVAALVLSGKILFMQADYAKAADAFQSALHVQPDFDIGYALALADLALKKPVPAGVIFDEMLASSKPDAGMRSLIGIAYREAGYFDEAAAQFGKAIGIDPTKPNIHAAFGIARFLQGPGHYGEAQKLFLSELAINPSDFTSAYYLGLVAEGENKPQEARGWLEKAAREQPGDFEVNFHLSKALIDLGRFDSAAAVLRKALNAPSMSQASPNLAEAHSLLSNALGKLGQKSEAEAERAEAAKLRARDAAAPSASNSGVKANLARLVASNRPGDLSGSSSLPGDTVEQSSKDLTETPYAKSLSMLLGEAYHNLGVVDARASRYSDASNEFAQAAKWNPRIETLDRNWGLAAFRAERFAEAAAPLQRELEKRPHDAEVREMLGVSYYMTNEFARSAETFRPIAAALPDNPGLLYAAGVSLMRAGDSADGSRLLSRMLRLGANSPEVHVMIAQAYSDQSRFADALSELQRALELNPLQPEVHYAIGMIYFKQGKLDDAVREFNAELARNPDSVAAKYQIADVQLQEHRAQEAIPLLNEVLAAKPSYADGHYQLGKALLETGDVAGAIQHLERAAQLQPGEAYAFYQLSLAYRRAGRTDDATKALRTFQELKEKSPAKSNPAQ